MNIFSAIGNYFTTKRLARLERDLTMIENKIKFEPKYSKLSTNIYGADKFTRKMTEYLVWSLGDVEVIREFFKDCGHLKNQTTTISPNLFWETAPDDYRFVHSGIPALISAKMATILFGKGVNVEMSVVGEDGEENDQQTEDMQKLTDELLREIHFEETLMKAGASASWGGHVFYKLSYDASLSQYPILESVDIRNGSEIKKRGITKAIVFRSWYQKTYAGSKTVSFRLDEIYRTVEQNDLVDIPEQQDRVEAEIGDALIEYRLYQMGDDGKETEVPIDSIEETQDIIKPKFAFKGLKGILAIGVPNKLPNNDFIDCPYGASDYAHSTTAFDALDEVMSEMARETRDNKSIRMWPDSMLPKDDRGRVLGPNAFVRNVLMYQGDQSQDAENKIEVQEIKDKTESLILKYKQAIGSACNNAEISPLALGITGLEAMNAGENSQRERNKATLETRNKKLQIIGPALEKVIERAVNLYAWMQRNVDGIEPHPLMKNADIGKVRASVHFPDYIIASDSENIDTWGKGVSMKVVDTQTAVEQIFADRTKEQQLEIATRIRFEQGISSDNPNALQMGDLLNPAQTEQPNPQT
jgi:hypothetical protein